MSRQKIYLRICLGVFSRCLGIQTGAYSRVPQEDSRSGLLKSSLEYHLEDSDGDLFKDSLRVLIEGSPILTHFRFKLIDVDSIEAAFMRKTLTL